MIKIDTIKIEEFRGIRNLTLEFNGKNYAVCGPNGTGKSGVVDALEFALTGNISRLSGEGMGNVSVKEHAPHVDSKNNPEKARINITFKIPTLENKQVTLARTVKNSTTPSINPSSPEILEILSQFDGHPEFVLSRREIIRYVISKPGDRSAEVQALLRLDKIGDLRSSLLTISNTYSKESKDSKKVQDQASESLAQGLEITDLVKAKILEAVNTRRTVLGLTSLTDLTATTALNDGLETSVKSPAVPKVNKVSATADLKTWREVSQKMTAESVRSECSELKDQLTVLSSNPIVTESVTREKFLRSAIDFVTEEACPVCDTKWDISTLQGIIRSKLEGFEEITKMRASLENRLEPIITLVDSLDNATALAEKLTKVLTTEHTAGLAAYRATLSSYRKALKDFLPLTEAIPAIVNITEIPADVTSAIEAIEKAVAIIPEPTQQDAARDFIVRAQDRLEAYRKVAREADKAKQRADLSKKVYDTYVDISTKALEGVYKDVEGEFSKLYRSVNGEDENSFTAKLVPSIGKLGFDVDFYGRGHFPPGAYHSEGHQDAMGLCLYLALMRKLQGTNFRFAVLDDVLMSVDSNHRREVCNLLKQQFQDTQFILTTHDEVWLKQMTTVGLIASGNATRFSNWTPDHGPAEWKTRDVWTEIDTALNANDVQSAASRLRYYLEYVFREVCDSLRAQVEFKGDGRYGLGDTLAPAVARFRKLMVEGKEVAESRSQTDVAKALQLQEKNLADSLVATNAEQWQVNPAIHYNEWANLSVNDFNPVVATFRNLVQKFFCEKPECSSFVYLTTTPPKTPDAVRCNCGLININLKKPAQKD
ncbi:MAG: AAA family ATPase [Patescibacteria group bacterium]|nr:AAA family ATPase [Patescibacteria group bacterium]